MSELLKIDYKDWLINQKRLPDRASEEATDFYEFHKKLALEGFMMEGEYINPFLYWHLNMWHTEVDVIDSRGFIFQKYINPYFRDNEWVITNAIDKANREKKGLAIGGIRRLAKALKNDELLYTPSGSINIGNAKVGDKIFDHNGELTTITGVFPQGKIPIYKMELEDSRVIYCCENHIWRVLDRRNGRKIKDMSIKELIPIYKHKRIHNGYKDNITRNIEECFFAIPNNRAINYNETKQLIDPYYLGLWLGDGSSRRTGITTIDSEIKDYIYSYANKLNLSVRIDGDEYILNSGLIGGRNDKNILLNYFKYYNLLLNKHIPNEYLYGSVEQRLELLKGLMDTDGSVYSNGTISFTTTSKQLAIDFFQLCRGLGLNLTRKQFTPKLYGKNCGIGWLFTIFTEEPIFKLQRKLNNYKIGNKGKQSKINYTTIKNIELIGEDYATCITVDNNDKLFLTTDYTVTHNSVLEASYTAWGASFDENSQNVIAGLNSPDIKLITDKLDKGLNHLPWYYKWDRIEDNWKQQVSLGIKSKSGERYPFSYILIRNLDDGNNEEAIAGTKPRKLIIDEGAKGAFLKGLMAAIPGFTTPYGWGCSPIVTFTGGDAKKYNDAKQLMFDCGAFNFLEFDDEDNPNRKHGLFLGHKYRLEAKTDSNFGEFIGNPKLKDVKMQVSDTEKADKVTDELLEKAKKSNDRATYLKEKMYYPKKVDDIFLNEDTNIFDIELCKRQKARILAQDGKGTPVILHMGENGVYHEFTDKLPITNFPLKPTDEKDAPVVILEFPMENPPYGLYVAGTDPYRQGQAKYSSSLGSIYIYKRINSITGEGYQDMMVAYYTARPDKHADWNEQARLLTKYYNARNLCENDEMSFIDYMLSKNEAYYLERQPEWLKEIVPNTTVTRDFGIHRSAEKIRNFLHTCLKKYIEEVIYEEKDENGQVIKQVFGVSRILDPMLLEEIIQFNEDGNYDRIVAFELAVALAMKLNPILGAVGDRKHDIVNALGKNKQRNVLFTNGNNLFSSKKQKLWM